MLDANLKTQLKAYLEKVSRPIEIVASVDDSAKSQEMLALLNDIATLSERVSVIERRGDDERKPSFSIGEPGKAAGIRFAGIPMGHEFTSLVLALLQTGGHPIKLDDAVIQQIRELDGDFAFETYFSLSCQNCPEVVQALNIMALINPRIQHVAIDGALFQNEVESRQIMAVPTMFLNGEVFGQGRSGVKEILAKLDTNAGARREGTGEQVGVRRADRRRRSCWRGGRDLRGAQGHCDGRRRGTLRRPCARHAGDRKLRVGAGNGRAEVRHGA